MLNGLSHFGTVRLSRGFFRSLLEQALALLCLASERFSAAEHAHGISAETLRNALHAVIDGQSDSTGWQDFIDLSRDISSVHTAAIESKTREQLRKEFKVALNQIDKGIEKVLDAKFKILSESIEYWWNCLRGDESTFFSSLKRRGRNTIDFKGGLSPHADRTDPKVRDVIAIFSDSQLHCLGLSIFLARVERYGIPFVVLDDPVLSSDEDYRAHFRTRVIGRLHELGIQIIVLTQHRNTRRDIATANQHYGIDQFQIDIINPANGSMITKTGDELSAMLTSAEAYTNTTSIEIRKDGSRKLRDATERFCKELLVRKRRASGDANAAISDYEGRMLGGRDGLLQEVTPHLNMDPSHPGKLQTIHADLNPPSHDDDDIPSRQALREALGNLRKFKKDYL